MVTTVPYFKNFKKNFYIKHSTNPQGYKNNNTIQISLYPLTFRFNLLLIYFTLNIERQTVNIFFVPRQLENELLRNNLFENGVSTLSLENQKQHKIIKTKKHTVADKTGTQKLKSTFYLRHMSATFVAYTI